MDPILNCITGVCCQPAEQRQRLASALMEYCHLDADAAAKAAHWLLDTFDFAEAGTLTALKASIARLARG